MVGNITIYAWELWVATFVNMAYLTNLFDHNWEGQLLQVQVGQSRVTVTRYHHNLPLILSTWFGEWTNLCEGIEKQWESLTN